MPRTKNVTRSQWDAANAIHGSKSKENGHESEKENPSRATRSSARTGGRSVLGPVTTATAPRATSSKVRGKGKPPPKGTSTKTEKLPLQDITARFLPAPESANRGHTQPAGFGAPENLLLSPAGPSNSFSWRINEDEPILNRSTTTRVFPSSLPPSSPPSLSSTLPPSKPQLPILSRSPTPIARSVARRLFDRPGSGVEQPPYDVWQEFDFVVPESEGPSNPQPTPPTSDPFGFFALERRLKVEREEAQKDDDGVVLVNETSPEPQDVHSPSPPAVEPVDALIPAVFSTKSGSPHIPPTPPTPHKKGVHGRSGMSDSEEHIFGLGSSPCPSSPSPSKRHRSSAMKRKVVADFDSIHDEVDDGTPQVQKVPGRKHARQDVEDIEVPRLRRSQRGRDKKEADEQIGGVTAQLGVSRKSRSTKSKSKQGKSATATKKEANRSKKAAIHPAEDSDAEEKRALERQARIEYFRQLKEYEIETEDVYVI